MIALSARHIPVLVVLLVLLLVPLLRVRFDVRRVESCAHPEMLRDLARIPGAAKSTERFSKLSADITHWSLAELANPERGLELRGLIARSFKPIDLYTRPPSALLGKFEAGQRHVERVEADGEILPIQTIYDSTNGKNSIATYLFVYDGEPVEHPVLAQLLSAPSLVWNGTRPLTLLMVGGPVIIPKRERARTIANDWLVAAYRLHKAACTP